MSRNDAATVGSPWFVAVLLLSAAWWTLDLAVLRSGAPHPSDDHWEDLLIAEHVLEGGGFRTQLIYPPLWELRDTRTLNVPVLVHGPLLPLLTVPVLAVLGPERLMSVAPAAAMVALLALIPIFRLGARHFGVPVGVAAAGLFTLSPLVLEAVHHSGSVVAGAALMAWTLDLLARSRPRAIAAGFVAGLSLLVRPETLVALPVLAVLAWRHSRSRWPSRGSAADAPPVDPVLGFLGAFVIVALPWWIHHARGVGSPFFSLTSYTLIGYWKGHPDVSVMQDFALTPQRWPAVLRAELPHMAPKWIAFFPHAVKNALFAPSGATGWLAIVGSFAALVGVPAAGTPRRLEYASSELHTRRFAACGLLLALIPVASMTLTSHQRLYLVPFFALFTIGAALGASVLARMLPEWAHRPRAWVGLLVLLVLPSALPAIKGGAEESRALRQRLVAERETLMREAPRPDRGLRSGGRDQAKPRARAERRSPRLLFSDTPDFVAWVTDRPTLWVTREQFGRLYTRRGRTAEAARLGLPPRDEVAGWFHDDFRSVSSVGIWVRP